MDRYRNNRRCRGTKPIRNTKVLECDEIQGYIFGRPVPPEIFELEHIDKTTLSSK